MWTAAALNNGARTKYGFGFYVNEFAGHRNIRHSGSTSGFSSDIECYPEDRLTVIVLTNADTLGAATRVAQAVAELYLQTVLLGK